MPNMNASELPAWKKMDNKIGLVALWVEVCTIKFH